MKQQVGERGQKTSLPLRRKFIYLEVGRLQ